MNQSLDYMQKSVQSFSFEDNTQPYEGTVYKNKTWSKICLQFIMEQLAKFEFCKKKKTLNREETFRKTIKNQYVRQIKHRNMSDNIRT